MLKPFGLSIFFYRTKTILSTKILENTPTNTQRAYCKTPIFVTPNIHIQTRNILLPICNNITFKKQKPYFCNAKTHFLHAKNHTFVLRICNIHRMNTLRTFREISTHPTKTPNEHPRNVQRNTPQGVGADSSRPYPYIIKYTYSFHQICVSVPHFVGVSIYAGTINRPLQLLTDCHFATNGLQ